MWGRINDKQDDYGNEKDEIEHVKKEEINKTYDTINVVFAKFVQEFKKDKHNQ